MKSLKVKILLFSSLMLMVLIPSMAVYWQAHDVLNSSFSLSRDSDTIDSLELGQEAFKKLAKLNPSQEGQYHAQFVQIQNVKMNLAEKALLQEHLVRSFTSYFFASVVGVTLVALVLALFLSQKVASAYDQNLIELIKQKEKNQFLEGISHWQEVAKQLAHEIKGPLQPIGLWMKNLVHASKSLSSQEEFSGLLREADAAISDEIQQLQRLVDSFTRFSRLPEVRLQPLELGSFVKDFHQRYQGIWEIQWRLNVVSHPLSVQADPNLLRQVLTNLMNNAVEANPEAPLQVTIGLYQEREQAVIIFENTGRPLKEELRRRIFEPYFTTKGSSKNFGLGLSIVRKILIDQGGEIQLEDSQNGVKFKIQLPIVGE